MPPKESNKKSTIKPLTAVLAIVIIISIIVLAYTALIPPQTNEENDDQQNGTFPTKEAPTILTVSYDNQFINYTQSDLNAFETTTGYGGFRTSFPSIKGLGNYTGIGITDLLQPLTQNLSKYSITVIADDGYINNYTYDEILGNVSIYDATNASNEEPITSGGVIMLLAFEFEDQPLDKEIDGQFKIVYINGTDAITSSRYWAKFVVEIQINTE